jgi:hypothetical protein
LLWDASWFVRSEAAEALGRITGSASTTDRPALFLAWALRDAASESWLPPEPFVSVRAGRPLTDALGPGEHVLENVKEGPVLVCRPTPPAGPGDLTLRFPLRGRRLALPEALALGETGLGGAVARFLTSPRSRVSWPERPALGAALSTAVDALARRRALEAAREVGRLGGLLLSLGQPGGGEMADLFGEDRNALAAAWWLAALYHGWKEGAAALRAQIAEQDAMGLPRDFDAEAAAQAVEVLAADGPIRFSEQPLAWLLGLCDAVQEWQRPRPGRDADGEPQDVHVLWEAALEGVRPETRWPFLRLEEVVTFRLDFRDRQAYLQATDFDLPAFIARKEAALSRLISDDPRLPRVRLAISWRDGARDRQKILEVSWEPGDAGW